MELITLDQIKDNPYQPRQNYEGIDELAAKIKAMAGQLPETRGLIHVPNGRQLPDGEVELAEGHRRLRAFRLLAEADETYQAMPVNTIELSDEAMDDIAWDENRDRQDLNPIEEALALKRTMENRNLNQTEVAQLRQLGRSTVSNKLRLLELPEELIDAARAGQISERHGIAYLPLLQVPEKDLKLARSRLKDKTMFNVSWDAPTPQALARRLIEHGDLSTNQVRQLVERTRERIEQEKKREYERRQAEEAQRKAAAAAEKAAAQQGQDADSEEADEPDWLKPAPAGSETAVAAPPPSSRETAPPPPPPPPPPPAPKPQAPPKPPAPSWQIIITIKPGEGLATRPCLISALEGSETRGSWSANYSRLPEILKTIETDHLSGKGAA